MEQILSECRSQELNEFERKHDEVKRKIAKVVAKAISEHPPLGAVMATAWVAEAWSRRNWYSNDEQCKSQ